MWIPKNRIPELTAILLTLGGCRDKPAPTFGGAVCQQIQACDPALFSEEFDGLQECTEAYSNYVGVPGTQDELCLEAYTAYYTCLLAQSCDRWNTDLSEPNCAHEYMDYSLVCADEVTD